MVTIRCAIKNLKAIKDARFATLVNNTSELYEKIVLDDLESLDMAIEMLRTLSRERIDSEIVYQQGFRNGFTEGQSKGLEIATNALAMQVNPIIIKCEDKEMVKKIMENLGGNNE